jgi:Tol biopolymer transport system component
VIVPPSQIPQNSGAPEDDGIWLANTATGASRLLISLKSLVEQSRAFDDPSYRFGDFYAFHTKWSPDGKRIMLVLRWTPKEASSSGWWKFKPASKTSMRKNVVTLAFDGTDVHVAVPDHLWARGGHHPNWCPDGEHIVMNLDLEGEGLRFVRVKYDGTGLCALHPTATGSGHPSINPAGTILMSDAYPKESVAYGDGSVPIRLIDLASGIERRVLRINCRPEYIGDRKEMRVDAHPAWSPDGRWISFNGCPDGSRRVFLAWVGDMKNPFATGSE